MERLKPSPVDVASADGPLVEVTLQSISGLTCHLQTLEQVVSPNEEAGSGQVEDRETSSFSRIPSVTAAVAFSGSAKDMQVGSSCLCARTGNVLVESQVAHSPPSRALDDPNNCPLVAEWHGNEGSSLASQHPVSPTSSSSQYQKPHLTIRLPKRDPKLPSVPLTRMNRDCHVVHSESYTSSMMPPSLDESDISSHHHQEQGFVGEETNSKTLDDGSDVRGASIVWSASGAGMPEIIELHVSLIVDADDVVLSGEEDSPRHSGSSNKWNMQQTTYEVGVAYLVFFGSDAGTTVLDLPIKKHLAQHTLSAQINPGVTVDDDAFLRVTVNVVPHGKPTEQSPETKYADAQIVNMQTLEPILQQLRIAHEDHQREIRRHRLEAEKKGNGNQIQKDSNQRFVLRRRHEWYYGHVQVLYRRCETVRNWINRPPLFGIHGFHHYYFSVIRYIKRLARFGVAAVRMD